MEIGYGPIPTAPSVTDAINDTQDKIESLDKRLTYAVEEVNCQVEENRQDIENTNKHVDNINNRIKHMVIISVALIVVFSIFCIVPAVKLSHDLNNIISEVDAIEEEVNEMQTMLDEIQDRSSTSSETN